MLGVKLQKLAGVAERKPLRVRGEHRHDRRQDVDIQRVLEMLRSGAIPFGDPGDLGRVGGPLEVA